MAPHDPTRSPDEAARLVRAEDLDVIYAEITAQLTRGHPLDTIQAYGALCALAIARVRLLEERPRAVADLECGGRRR